MIKIIAVGKLKEPYIKSGFEEYKKRLQRFTRLEVLELKEKDAVHGHLRDKDIIVILDESGENLTSIALSEFIKQNHLEKDVVFVIGGPDGFNRQTLTQASFRLSLSKMTFTSQMARLILIEQIYRAFTIINGVGYHR